MVGERGRIRGGRRPAGELSDGRHPLRGRPLRVDDGARLLDQGGDESRAARAVHLEPFQERLQGRRRPDHPQGREPSAGAGGADGTPRVEERDRGAGLVPAGCAVPLARRSRLRKKPALVPTAVAAGLEAAPAAARSPTGAGGSSGRRRDEAADGPPGWTPVCSPIDEAAMTEPARRAARRHREAHQTRLMRTGRCCAGSSSRPTSALCSSSRSRGPEVVHRLYTPATAKPFRRPRAALAGRGPPLPPNVAFVAHTVHRAPLKTPSDETPPDSEPAGG